MVELMVVITIILLLIGLTVVLVAGAGGTAREAQTKATIAKINSVIEGRRSALDRAITTGELRGQVRTLAASSLYNEETATIAVRKNAYKSAFPMSWAEADASKAGAEIARNVASEADNSEVLYWIVINGGTFGYEPVDTGQFDSNSMADTDGDGNIEFVDGWGTPLRFYRWPTRLVRPGGTTIDLRAAELLFDGVNQTNAGSDPDDPKGKLTALINESAYHTPNTFHSPLIVSAGADQILGLFEPTDTANAGHLAQPSVTVDANVGNTTLNDNITNRQPQGGN